MLNKNTSKLRNKAIVTDLILVFFTIVIPIFFLKFNIELKLAIVPIFIILYILFRFLNNHVHKLYLKNEDVEKARTVIDKTLGGIDKPNTGIMFGIDLTFVAGLNIE